MIPVYLIGGGWDAETFSQTYGCFLQAATNNNKRRIAIVVADEGNDSHKQFLRFFGAFETIGLDSVETYELIVSADKPLLEEKLAEVQPTGVFVCGGLTPAYYEALCRNNKWLAYLFENKIPYCGFSAGSSIASKRAIIGGWQREINNRKVQVADENTGEDIDLLDVRNGLGLVDFAVDVHASQWGTFSRLVHTIDADLADEGWAIDENTMLEVINGKVKVFGAGNAYQATRQNDEIRLSIFQADL